MVAISDPTTGWQFVQHQDARTTLFRLGIRREIDGTLEWHESADTTQFTWETREDDEGAVTVAMIAAGFKRAGLSVRVEVAVQADAALSVWRRRVEGLGGRK